MSQVICNNCQLAGDINKVYIKEIDSKKKQDTKGRVQALHSLCTENDCFCQHRIGNQLQDIKS